jgi:hypothetical protein
MLNMKWTLSAAMLAAAFAGIAPQASAQASEHYRGTFKLPVEARFGNTVLQPGTYTVSTLEGAKGIRITGDSGHAAILAAGYDVKPATENGRIILVDSNGMYALESFESGAMGKALHFYIPKSSRRPVESASVKPAIEVGMQ